MFFKDKILEENSKLQFENHSLRMGLEILQAKYNLLEERYEMLQRKCNDYYTPRNPEDAYYEDFLII